jgi:hypothetical protein
VVPAVVQVVVHELSLVAKVIMQVPATGMFPCLVPEMMTSPFDEAGPRGLSTQSVDNPTKERKPIRSKSRLERIIELFSRWRRKR